MKNSQYYQIGGITIEVSSDLPFTPDTFNKKFLKFRVNEPGKDTIGIHHRLGLPFTKVKDLGEEVYYKPPWAIYKKDGSWIYVISPEKPVDNNWSDMAIFNEDYSTGDFYHKNSDIFNINNWHALTFFSSDQVLIAQLLACRQGIYLHSGAVIMDGKGLMFIGHSSAGKSTTIEMIKGRAEVLCDDRNIVRHTADGYRVYGTWSHGDVPLVSSSSAPLEAILFLKKSDRNRLVPLVDKRDIRIRLLACLIKPFLTAGWWDRSLAVIEDIARSVPCYEMEFDKSGAIVQELEKLIEGDTGH